MKPLEALLLPLALILACTLGAGPSTAQAGARPAEVDPGDAATALVGSYSNAHSGSLDFRALNEFGALAAGCPLDHELRRDVLDPPVYKIIGRVFGAFRLRHPVAVCFTRDSDQLSAAERVIAAENHKVITRRYRDRSVSLAGYAATTERNYRSLSHRRALAVRAQMADPDVDWRVAGFGATGVEHEVRQVVYGLEPSSPDFVEEQVVPLEQLPCGFVPLLTEGALERGWRATRFDRYRMATQGVEIRFPRRSPEAGAVVYVLVSYGPRGQPEATVRANLAEMRDDDGDPLSAAVDLVRAAAAPGASGC